MASRPKFPDENLLRTKLFQKELKELKNSLRYAESLLAKTKQENSQLSNMLQETDDLNKRLENDLEKEILRADSIEKELEKAKLRLNTQDKTLSQLEASLKSNSTEKSQEHENLLAELSALTLNYNTAQDEIETLNRSLSLTKNKLHQFVVSSKTEYTKTVQREIQEPDVQPNALLGLAASIPSLKSDNSKLELDNLKLFQLLSSVKQFKEFSSIAQDSNGLTFIPYESYHNKARAGDLKGEWVPGPVFKVLKQTSSYKNFTAGQVAGFVQKLNKAWQSREKNRVERLRLKHQQQVFKLKKELLVHPQSPSSEREAKVAHTPFKTPTKNVQQVMIKLQEEFIEFLCDDIEEFCERLEDNEEQVRNSQEWLVDSVVTRLNEYTNKLLEQVL